MPPDVSATDQRRSLAALLDWHLDCGVDLALDETPHDRYAESARAAQARAGATPAVFDDDPVPAPRRERSAPGAPVSRVAPPVFPDEAARAAKEAAAAATDLTDLAARLAAFDGCPFKAMAGNFLFGAGTPGARVMVLDAAPGEEEERGGQAFRGARARLLDNMLAAIGLNHETAYLAYFSPWRPVGDRTPTTPEAMALLPFARRHVELARPEILVLLGDPLARAMLSTNDTGTRLYGRWFDCVCGPASVRTMTLPALKTMVATSSMKRAAWRGLRLVAQAPR
jgi:DNA polymerase